MAESYNVNLAPALPYLIDMLRNAKGNAQNEQYLSGQDVEGSWFVDPSRTLELQQKVLDQRQQKEALPFLQRLAEVKEAGMDPEAEWQQAALDELQELQAYNATKAPGNKYVATGGQQAYQGLQDAIDVDTANRYAYENKPIPGMTLARIFERKDGKDYLGKIMEYSKQAGSANEAGNVAEYLSRFGDKNPVLANIKPGVTIDTIKGVNDLTGPKDADAEKLITPEARTFLASLFDMGNPEERQKALAYFRTDAGREQWLRYLDAYSGAKFKFAPFIGQTPLIGPQGQPMLLDSRSGTLTPAGGVSKPISEQDEKKLAEQQSIVDSLERLSGGYKAGYGGAKIAGDVLTEAQLRGIIPDKKGAAQWWQDYRYHENKVRNSLFGASLTEGERKAWQAANITRNMSDKQIQSNLRRRAEIERRGLDRMKRSIVGGGGSAAQVDAVAPAAPTTTKAGKFKILEVK
jgi:hypothetical protein